MAAIGDSITKAADSCCIWGDHPKHSWSTGGDSSDAVSSHYERILANNGAISGRVDNDAVDGSRMADAPGQASHAVARGAQYVTVLMGANDVCASSEAAMTPVADFRAQFQRAMTTVTTGSPAAVVYVVSIPDVYRLWYILHNNPNARLSWRLTGFCKSMLANPDSTAPADEARRQRVRQREIEYNTALAEVCAQFTPQCRFDGNVDGGAAFALRFTTSDVSTRDYFHPSIEGQRALAEATWNVGPFAN
jgi:lysophospholipase L1-like esterase